MIDDRSKELGVHGETVTTMQFKPMQITQRMVPETMTFAEIREVFKDCNTNLVIPLLDEVERLRRGEFICKGCGLRKDADSTGVDHGF